MIAFIVVGIVLLIAGYYLYYINSTKSEKPKVEVKPASQNPKASENIDPPPPPVPLPTPNVVVSSVTDPDNFPINANQTAAQVLLDNSAAWNPLPSNNGSVNNRMFKLCFKFASPVNIGTVSITHWGDTTHDAKTLKIFKNCSSFVDANMIKSYTMKVGTTDVQTFSLPETLVGVTELSLGLVANTEWQVNIRRVRFN